MFNIPQTLLAPAIACLISALLPAAALAQNYPEKPLTIVVAGQTGGSIDVLARQLVPFWEKTLGQTIIVENKVGAGGVTGVRYFIERPDDGYTIVICTAANFGAAVEKSNLKADDIEIINIQQFDPVSISVLDNSRFKTLETLIEEAQEKPNTITWGAPPSGAAAFIGKLLARDWKVDVRFVPQAGGTESDTALLGGHIDFKSGTAASDVFGLQGVRVLAVSSAERLSYLPDVLTLNEIGKKLGFEAALPNLGTARVLAAHASLKEKHPEIFQKLVESYEAAFNDPEYQEILKSSGQDKTTSLLHPGVATKQFRELVVDSLKYQAELGG